MEGKFDEAVGNQEFHPAYEGREPEEDEQDDKPGVPLGASLRRINEDHERWNLQNKHLDIVTVVLIVLISVLGIVSAVTQYYMAKRLHHTLPVVQEP